MHLHRALNCRLFSKDVKLCIHVSVKKGCLPSWQHSVNEEDLGYCVRQVDKLEGERALDLTCCYFLSYIKEKFLPPWL